MEGHRQVAIDYYAYQSRLKEWNVSYKVILALSALILVITVDDLLISVVTLLYMGGVSCLAGKVRVLDYLRLLGIPIVFILMSALAILIQFGTGTGSIFCVPVFDTNLYITKEGMKQAFALSSKAMGAVSCVYLVTLSTPMGEIIRVFRSLHVPGIILELMHFIYRYIFILMEINQRQKDAVSSRLGYQSRKNALRVFGCEMANLLILSMDKGRNYYDALESRGYDGDCLFWEEKRKLTGKQLIWGMVYMIVVILLILNSLKWR